MGSYSYPAASQALSHAISAITQGTTSVVCDYHAEHTRIRQVEGTKGMLCFNDPASGVSMKKVPGAGGSSKAPLINPTIQVFDLQALSSPSLSKCR